MCEIINKIYTEEDLYDAFESIADKVYDYTNKTDEYKYYRIIISEVNEEEYLKEEDV